MLPTVAVQIEPSAPPPALELQLLRACSAGLERARCVSARDSNSEPPQGIAVVAWDDAGHASITLFAGLGARLRAELLVENVAVTVERGPLTDR